METKTNKKTNWKAAGTILAVLTLMAFGGMQWAMGQISIPSLPYTPASTNFNSFNPSSAGNLTTTIPTGWTASSSGTAAHNGQGTGTSTTGGYWGLGSPGDYSLGALRSGGPGNITYGVSYINNTGTTITSLSFSWDYEQYLFTNTSGWNCSGTGSLAGNANIDSRDFTGSASGTNGNVSVTGVAFTIYGLSIANGATFGLSFVTTDPANADNVIAIDNFLISTNSLPTIFGNTSTFTAPAGITAVQAECYGGGGGGGERTNGNQPSAGAGGGAYTKKNSLGVTAGTSVPVTVGAGVAAETAGNSSSISTVSANGGGAANNATAGLGGTAGVTGDINSAGGAGGTSTSDNDDAGGGGGASGHSGGTGAAGASTTTGTGGAGGVGANGGGSGGAGGNNDVVGFHGIVPGGAGGGEGGDGDVGGFGAPGRVILTFACPTYILNAASASPATRCGSGTSTITLSHTTTTNLPTGTYTVVYTVNAGATQTAAMTVSTAGTGTFTTGTLSTVGANTIAITELHSGLMGTSSDICISMVSGISTVVTIITPPTPTSTVAETSGTANDDGTICNGASVDIGTTIAYSSYAWSTGATTSTITESPTVSTTYTVTVTDGNGCTASTARLITVGVIPQISAFTGNTICSGAQGTLTLTSTGTGPFSAVINGGSYSSITSGAAFNVSPALANPTSTTNYTVTSITSAQGCNQTTGFTDDEATITVNGVPDASNFQVTGATSPIFSGATSAVSFSSSSLATGTYTIIYNRSAPNAATGVTTSVSFTAGSPGTASFNTAALANTGTTTVTITGIVNASNCTTAVSTNNTANVVVVNATSSQTFNSSASFAVPCYVDTVAVQAWGGGGAGGGSSTTSGTQGRGGAGGGGGAFASSSITVTPSSTLSVVVAAQVSGTTSAAGTNGNNSTITGFEAEIFAAGGTGGAVSATTNGSTSAGGPGGSLAVSIGNITEIAGGNGGNGLTSGITPSAFSGAGGAGANGGGAGGASITSGTAPGNVGAQAGGGGGGSRTSSTSNTAQAGGSGAAGRVIITYSCPLATIAYSSTSFCQSINSAAVIITGTNATTTCSNTFSSTAGLTLNTTTGEIDPSTSTPGIYMVHYQLPAAGGCSAVDATFSITIKALPTASCSHTNVDCVGDLDGDASVIAGAGNGIFSYLWNDANAQTTATSTGLGVGTYTVIVTSDGCTATCSTTIAANDNTPPTITCPSDITVSNDAGVCTGTVTSLGTPTTNDNCGIATTVNDHASSTYAGGNTTVTWTTTDTNGNTAQCTQTVTVVDTELPTITCPADITLGTDDGHCYTEASFGTATTGDNCGVLSTTNNALSQLPTGVNSITWTVTDVNGLTNTCIQSVTVVDDEAPGILCPNHVTVNADAGQCFATNVNLGSLTYLGDNCSGIGTPTNNGLLSYPLGTTPVTWTVVDAAGNTATCNHNVIVVDNQLPTITCPAGITVNNDAGVCTGTVLSLGTPATNDNCGIASTVNDHPSTTYAGGNTTVTWTVTDNSGNTASCIQTITVVDAEAPTITCPAAVTVSNDPGICYGSNIPLGTPITNDNCAILSTTNNADPSYYIGTYNVIWTITDVNGLTNTCVQSITIVDTEAPTISCPVNITINADNGLCEATNVNTMLGNIIGTHDNCQVFSYTYILPPSFPVGLNNVTWTVDDVNGNTNFCIQTVTVIDNQPPTITCPPIATYSCFAGIPAAAQDITQFLTAGGSVLDNCGGLTVIHATSQYITPPTTCDNQFVFYREYMVTDAAGSTASCQQVITINDNVVPVISNCPSNVTINCNDVLPSTAGLSFTDGCSPLTGTTPVAVVTDNGIACYTGRIVTYTWTATDQCGNTASCIQTISFNADVTGPVFNDCPADITLNCGNSVPSPASPTATDVCSGAATVVYNGQTLSFVPVACPTDDIIIRTWTATDACGNTTLCTQTISYNPDVTPPVITSCPADITLNCGDGLPPTTGLAFNDACSGSSVTSTATVVDNNPSCISGRVVTYTWTATDLCNNTAVCVQTISFNADVTAPVFDNCPSDITLNCGQSLPPVVNPLATDACSGSAFVGYNGQTQTFPTVGCPTDVVYTRSWTATDLCGNTSGCTQTISFNPDVTAPVISSCPADVTLNCGDPLPPTAGLTFMDLCTGPGITPPATVNDNALTCITNRVVTYSWTATDACGNTASCVQTITFNADVTGPVFSNCPADVTLNCGDPTPPVATPSALDVCSGAATVDYNGETQSFTITVGCPTDIVYTRTWTATDACGNTTGCTQTISYNPDVTPPTIICPQSVTVNADLGVCTASGVSLGSPTVSDLCSGVGIPTNNELSVYPGGNTNVTWTVTDGCGNTASCIQTVTVVDVEAPSITCPNDVTVNANNTGCTATGVALGNPTVADNCSGFGSPSNNGLVSYLLGNTVVTWTILDASGNSNSCTQNVLVINPVSTSIGISETSGSVPNDGILCAGESALLDAGSGFANYSWSPGGATTQTISASATGIYVVTVTDANGCSNTAQTSITVNPNPVCSITGPNPAYSNATNVVYAAPTGMSSYSWSVSGDGSIPGSTSGQTVSVTTGPAGPMNVAVTITNSDGCSSSCNENITFILAPLCNISGNLSFCTGSSTTLTASAGVSSYEWSTGASTQSINVTAGGTYTVILTGSNSVTSSCEVIVVENSLPIINVTTTSVSCFGGSNGTATANASGGGGGYQYVWSNSMTTSSISNLVAGTYSVVVSDINGCSNNASGIVNEPTALSNALSQVNIKCKGSNTGSINTSAGGGTTPYSYLWNNGTTNANATNLFAGTYTVTVTDANGCTKTLSTALTQPAAVMTISFSKTNVRCGGKHTGAATAIPAGGVGPYTYVWDDLSTSDTRLNLAAGSYTVTVTDAAGCIKSKVVTITENPLLTLSAAPTGATTALATAGGGVPAYTYVWNTVPAQTTAGATGLIPGNTYKVKVTDSKGCTTLFFLTMPTPKAQTLTDAESKFNVTVYPNPTDGIVNLNFVNTTNKDVDMKLYDGLGKIVYSGIVTNQEVTAQFNFRYLPKGIYSLHLTAGDKLKVLKVVLQ